MTTKVTTTPTRIFGFIFIWIYLFVLLVTPLQSALAADPDWQSWEDWSAYAATGFADGDGSLEDPYQIATAMELAYLANQANGSARNNSSGEQYENNYFELTANINLDGKLWTPIRNKVGLDAGNTRYGGFKGHFGGFKGHFDGKGHTISNIYIFNLPYGGEANESYINTHHYIGFFGFVEQGFTLKNLNLNNVNINSVNQGLKRDSGLFVLEMRQT